MRLASAQGFLSLMRSPYFSDPFPRTYPVSHQMYNILWEGLPLACSEGSVTVKRAGMLHSSFPNTKQTHWTGWCFTAGPASLRRETQEIGLYYQMPPRAFCQIPAMPINKQQKVIFASVNGSFSGVSFFDSQPFTGVT